MKIGFVKQNEYKVKDSKVVKWLEVVIRVPFGSCTLTLTKVKEKSQDNSPDYHLFFSPNRRGENYSRMKVGSLWLKVSEKGNTYMSGYIESPLVTAGKIYLSIVKYTPMENMPVEDILYNVLWSPNEERKENGSDYAPYIPPTEQAPTTTTTTTTTANNIPVEIEITEDEIPF